MPVTLPPPAGAAWVGLASGPLPVTDAQTWVVEPRCGGVVSFLGTVRDHADGRAGVSELTYEAYAERAEARLAEVAAEARCRFPTLGRLVLLHRVGTLAPTDVAVCVVAAAPHRDEAFAAARFGIDAMKATVPIWKRERWADGEGWGTGAQPLVTVGDVGPS